MKTKKEKSIKKLDKKPDEKLETPEIQVISVTDQPDGSALLTYDINDAMIEVIGKEIGKTRPTKAQINKWLLNVLEKASKEEDGYKFVTKKKKGKK